MKALTENLVFKNGRHFDITFPADTIKSPCGVFPTRGFSAPLLSIRQHNPTSDAPHYIVKTIGSSFCRIGNGMLKGVAGKGPRNLEHSGIEYHKILKLARETDAVLKDPPSFDKRPNKPYELRRHTDRMSTFVKGIHQLT